jgi:hypothetical protein
MMVKLRVISQDQIEAVATELGDEVQDDAPDRVLPSDGDDDDDADINQLTEDMEVDRPI